MNSTVLFCLQLISSPFPRPEESGMGARMTQTQMCIALQKLRRSWSHRVGSWRLCCASKEASANGANEGESARLNNLTKRLHNTTNLQTLQRLFSMQRRKSYLVMTMPTSVPFNN